MTDACDSIDRSDDDWTYMSMLSGYQATKHCANNQRVQLHMIHRHKIARFDGYVLDMRIGSITDGVSQWHDDV